MEMLNRLKCTHCGSSELDRDPSRGDTVCTSCGSVLEESIIVSEVQFSHDSHGASRAIGQLVTADGNVPGGLNLGHTFGLAKESRKITLQNARRKISDLAMKLNLPERCVDMAHNFYKMALAKKFTQGRKNPHVIAACVYLVCRREETPHMLLDLSDVLHINVYELGKTYLKLQSDLCINTPTIDPTMYILRFSHQLDFGKKLEDVAYTASRLLQRMKRDWIHTGRRPSGLCGAALLVAARMHGFNRTVKDMIKVVKVCQATVRKRLCEFSDTPSSRLTLDEFMTIDLEEEQDPPAFKAARKKKDLEIEEQKLEEAQQDVHELQKEIESILEKTRKQKFARTYSKIFQSSTSDSPADDSLASQMFIANSTEETIDEVLESVNKEDDISSMLNDVDKPDEIGIEHNVDGIPSAEYFNELLMPVFPPKNEVLLDDSETARLIFPDDFKIENKEDCELDITGLDDDELDRYLSTNDEIKSKACYWFTMNGKYIKERKEKEEKRLKEEAESAKKEPKKKRRRQKREPIHASTTEEAIEKVLAQKKVSLKLDYNVLKNLNTQTESEEVTKEEDTVELEDVVKSKKPKRVRLSKPKRPQPIIPNSVRQGISDLVAKARYEKEKKEKQLSEKQDEDSDDSQGPVLPMKQPESAVEEEATVQNLNSEPSCSNPYDSEEVSDEEVEPEDHVHLSAAQLLGNSLDEHEYMYYDE